MRVIVCGSGEVGTHVTEVLSALGGSITVVDADPERLRSIADQHDVQTLRGDCGFAHVLAEAGAEDADLVVAATSDDKTNLLTAALANRLGTRKVVARVHATSYFRHESFDYCKGLGVDRLICPEYSTAQAIAQTLRNPAAIAIENFAQGSIEIEQFAVDEDAPAVGRTLSDIPLPSGARLAVIVRGRSAFVPDGASRVEAGDLVVLAGAADVFNRARALFQEKPGRRRVVLMGGPEMAIWLCEALRERMFSIRLFEARRARAEELAAKLPWITVLHADPTDRETFQEEQLGQADVFVAMRPDDEDNIIACVLAKSRGVTQTIAVVQRSNYLDVLPDIGVDRTFSPRIVAARQIESVLDDRPFRAITEFADGSLVVYRFKIGGGCTLVGRRLREVKLTPDWSIIVIRRGTQAVVPSAGDTLAVGDAVLVIGRAGREAAARQLFDVRDEA
jgi:trk system potassium uptake protein TrkA